MASTPCEQGARGANPVEVELLINRLKWKTSTDEFTDMNRLCVDCCQFNFKQPLTKEKQYKLLEFMETLDLNFVWSLALIGIWLYQNSVPFTMRFRYSRTRPLRYNLAYLFIPWQISRDLKKCMDEVMVYDLDAAPRGGKK